MNNIKEDFSIFKNNNDFAFFDTAASAQKPTVVIEKLKEIYSYQYANIHRGIYDLSAKLTDEFEFTRKIVAKFINAESEKNIIFTKNATEGINLVAQSYVKKFLNAGDEILISSLEHHSNIVPWQQVAKENGYVIKVIPLNKNHQLDYDKFEKLISDKTKFIAITHKSNVTGERIDIHRIKKAAKKYGAKILLDGCQSIPHMKIDVRDLDCDFFVFSSHKLYGPTGVGVLYGKYELLEKMDVYQVGGSMIESVNFDNTTFLKPPHKFEAGTPAIVEVIGFGEALKYLNKLDLTKIWNNEVEISRYIIDGIKKLKNFQLLYDFNDTVIIPILHKSAHHSDIGAILNKSNVAIRTGHLCAQPLMKLLNITGVARISIGIYNDMEDADKLINALKKIDKLFG
ncbi:MAG: cysteine desulfurase/selenocysteine lyase [Candidatus Midichloriaceae bacterium]|jgi:cysteine desulfurase/selenocysteine lyase